MEERNARPTPQTARAAPPARPSKTDNEKSENEWDRYETELRTYDLRLFEYNRELALWQQRDAARRATLMPLRQQAQAAWEVASRNQNAAKTQLRDLQAQRKDMDEKINKAKTALAIALIAQKNVERNTTYEEIVRPSVYPLLDYGREYDYLMTLSRKCK